MKAICLATVMTVVLTCLITLLLRAFPSEHRARRILVAYFFCLAALIIAWSQTPADIWIFEPSLLTEPPLLDLTLALFFFSAAFFGGVLQLYNLADRGFSLRVLIDLAERAEGGGTAEALAAGYSAGRGIRWMYDKRMRGLADGGFITRNDGMVSLTPKGRFVGTTFDEIRGFLRLDAER